MSAQQKIQLIAAKDLLESHKQQASQERRRNNFDSLWQTLEGMRKEGFTSFPIAEVGRRSAVLGGPKCQTIRNKNGEPYREIIGLYSAAFPKIAQLDNAGTIDRALSTITNASARQIIADKLHEFKALERQRDQLRLALAQQPITPQAPPTQTTAPALSPHDIAALQMNFSATRLAERGLTLGADGVLKDESGVVLFTADAMNAINAVLKHHGQQPLPHQN